MDDFYEKRKQLFKDISFLSKAELEELFRILRNEGGEYSENSNGIFFDVSTLPDSIYLALSNFIKFCKTNTRELEERNKLISAMSNEPKVS
jgi:hypothetical protein